MPLGVRVGVRIRSRWAYHQVQTMGSPMTMEAVSPLNLRPPMKVVVLQWPWGT